MKSSELREKYLKFFEKQGHTIIPSASLIPENDPTVLFTTAGMHPLVPYLLGEKHPAGTRLTNAQKCIRTGDIDDVGDNRHLTFFEMLGNWSLGDYFKKEAIAWSFEFLTSKKWLGLDPKRLYITVFAGEDDIAIDEESIKEWKKQFESAGISAEISKTGKWQNENVRIFALGKNDNWWGLATGGPCGPCTEMFYDTNPDAGFDLKSFQQLVDDFRFIEAWNDVFMQFNKKPDGSLEKLAKPNVDTGMGLERALVVLNGKKNVFETDLFEPIIAVIKSLSGSQDSQAEKIIADHTKAAIFMIADGVIPSNIGRGYVLRKLIRRQVRYSHSITMNNNYPALVEIIAKMYDDAYPEIRKNKKLIVSELDKEFNKFIVSLKNGLKMFQRLVVRDVGPGGEIDQDSIIDASPVKGRVPIIPEHNLTAEWFFDLYQTFGFPLELSLEETRKAGVDLSSVEIERIKKGFNKELEKHQELSRTASAGAFKGGLADNSEQTTKLHTAAHLMLAGLRKVLGTEVYQKGSNITAERLRFDFSHKEKMTPEEIKQVEDFVNEAIKEDAPVAVEEVTLEKAKELGAMGVFESKYGDKVKVYTIEKNGKIISREICGGPHVERTGVMGNFKITKEESSSSGVRRIKAVLE